MKKIVSILLIAVITFGFNQQAFAAYYDEMPLEEYTNINVNNGLINLVLYHPQKRTIIQTENHEKNFENSVQEYDMYLLSADAKEFDIQPKIRSNSDVVKINGVQYFNNQRAKINLNDIQNNKILIETVDRNTNQPHIYTINIYLQSDASLEPKIKLSIDKKTGNEYADLTVSLENTRTNAFSISIYNTDADVNFANIKNEPFNNSNVDLAQGGNGINYYELMPDVARVVKMTFNGKDLTVSFKATKNNGSILANETVDLFKLRIKVPKKYAYKDIKEQIRIATEVGKDSKYNALLDLEKYGEVTHRVFVSDSESDIRYGSKDKTLVYIEGPKKYSIEMYVNYSTTDDLVQYTIENIDTSKIVVNQEKLIDGSIDFPLEEGNYKLSIESNGYLTYEKEISISDKDVYFRSVKLLAGDVQGDSNIDANDRNLLLTVYNTVAKDGKSGTTAADFNNDNWVNTLDLGQLLVNMGRKYN